MHRGQAELKGLEEYLERAEASPHQETGGGGGKDKAGSEAAALRQFL